MIKLTHQEAEEFLYREARMLDNRKFEEWLDLFTKDAFYWVPYRNNVEPHVETPIIFDDRATMEDRVFRLRSPAVHAQSPASRTVHMISNVMVEEQENDRLMIGSNFIVYEVRSADQRSFAGQYEHHLRFEDGRWKIALKKIWLVNRDSPIYNLTFLI